MKTNSIPSLPRLGSIVRFPLQRGGFSTGTIAKIDRKSPYARAYGAQVSFSDSGYSACLAQCEKIGQTPRKIRTANPCAKIRAEFNKVLAQLDKEARADRCKGDICTGWDWPTLASVKPHTYAYLQRLDEDFKKERKSLIACGLHEGSLRNFGA